MGQTAIVTGNSEYNFGHNAFLGAFKTVNSAAMALASARNFSVSVEKLLPYYPEQVPMGAHPSSLNFQGLGAYNGASTRRNTGTLDGTQ